MRTLDIRVSYNTTLLSFIDSLAHWDYFVSSHILQYFKERYGITEDEQRLLDSYAGTRKSLGWSEETGLLNWAFAGFPEDSKYSSLLPVIKHFENKIIQEGNRTLKDELEYATHKLATRKEELITFYDSFNVAETLSVFAPVFESSERIGSLPAYITYTPYNYAAQGGANGDGIYVQVFPECDSDELKHKAGIFVHEFLHKELNPGRFFAHHPVLGERYSRVVPEIYSDDLAQLMEEVIVYALSNVLMLNEHPQIKMKRYDEKYRDDPNRRNHWVTLWSAVENSAPLLQAFRENKISMEQLRQDLDNALMKEVERGIERFGVYKNEQVIK